MNDGYDGYDEAAGPERTFAAAPPAHGRGFAESWWGRAWLKALEDTALDGRQLKKGRKLAREGRLGAVSVRPGRVTAMVQDRDSTTYRADVLLQELSGEGWDQFLDMAVDRAGHVAALLDRDMPPHLVEDAAEAGVDLLPGIGDLDPECTCDAWDHCPHTAALAYQVARLLDQDPFVLLLLRGRGERQLLDDLQVRIAVRASGQGPAGPGAPPEPGGPLEGQPGVRADEAFAARDILPPLPAPPLLPEEAGIAPSLDTGDAPQPDVDPAALELLAADSAARAHRMLREALAPDHEHQFLPAGLSLREDAVRLIAEARPGSRITTRLAEGAGLTPAGLDASVRAWRCGGPAALAVLDDEWAPDAAALARTGNLLAGAWEDGESPELRREHNRWTTAGGEAQLRYGRDGRWWPYRELNGDWIPAGPAEDDPAAALAGARGED